MRILYRENNILYFNFKIKFTHKGKKLTTFTGSISQIAKLNLN